jgi:hypothetical protein
MFSYTQTLADEGNRSNGISGTSSVEKSALLRKITQHT